MGHRKCCVVAHFGYLGVLFPCIPSGFLRGVSKLPVFFEVFSICFKKACCCGMFTSDSLIRILSNQRVVKLNIFHDQL